jgi:hypothetical protein
MATKKKKKVRTRDRDTEPVARRRTSADEVIEKVLAKPSKRPRPQRVVAKRLGFYGNKRRKPGEAFLIPAGEKLGSWMISEEEFLASQVSEEEEQDEDGVSTGDDDVL